jgi:hypothetical protein
VAPKPFERDSMIGDGRLRRHAHGAEHVRLLEELRLDVIDGAHPVDERDVPGRVETDVDDVALGRRDGHVVDPFFALVAAQIRGDHLHAASRNAFGIPGAGVFE